MGASTGISSAEITGGSSTPAQRAIGQMLGSVATRLALAISADLMVAVKIGMAMQRCGTTFRSVECRYLAAAFLSLLALVVPPTAWATHAASEPSDGTVGSFRQLNPPREPPFFEILDANGKALTLADFHGKVVLLNLWATWCAPCIREMPALDRLQDRIGDDDFFVVPVALDREGRRPVEAFYKRLGLRHLGMYLDPDLKIEAAFPIDVLPANFLVDREGRVTAFVRSYVDWEAPEAEAMIRKLLASPAVTR